MKITIKKWRAIGAWKWSVEEERCGICQQNFNACCPDCKYPGDDCPPVWGKCNHPLHLHCIEKWLQQAGSREQCPYCRQPWQLRG